MPQPQSKSATGIPGTARTPPGDAPAPAATGADLQEQTAAILKALPKYISTRDLIDAFNGRGPLLTAYLRGWLDLKAVEVLEADPRLPVWLLARLLVLTEHGAPPA